MNLQSRKRVLGMMLGLISLLMVGIFLPLHALSQQGATAKEEATTTTPARTETIHLTRMSSYSGSGAEIPAYDPQTHRLFVVTGEPEMEILDVSDPLSPTLVMTVPVGAGGANSVAIADGYAAVAVANSDEQADGFVHFYNMTGTLVVSVTAGALPDMVTFTPDGEKVVVANEGEPSEDYTVDPEGSVSVIDVSGGVPNVTQADVSEIGFSDFNAGGPRAGELPGDVRIFGDDGAATVAQDLEPEYVAVSADSSTAWVTLQENNAVAVIDLSGNQVTAIAALGFKDHTLLGNQLDPSNEDDGINLDNWPVWGMYQPDAIASYEMGGATYLITANEGDARDYDGYSEEVRVEDLTLDPTVFSATIQAEEQLGRLKTTTANGDTDGDGLWEEIYAYGGRSFSIWDGGGNLVFDSGDEIGHLTAAFTPESFNANESSATEFDERSDDKGAEPEGVTTGMVNGRTYAFIGLERIGGVMVYDVTGPMAPAFVQYIPPMDGDNAPEGLLFIPAHLSPTCNPLLLVSYEESGTVTVFGMDAPACTYLPLIAGE